VLSSLPGVDPSDPRIKSLLEQDKDKDAKDGEGEGK